MVEPERVQDLATLVAEIESERARDILGQPKLFGRLPALRVEVEPTAAANAASTPFLPMRQKRQKRPQRTK